MLVIVTGLLKYDKIDLNFLCMDKTNFDKTQMYEYGPPNSVSSWLRRCRFVSHCGQAAHRMEAGGV